MNFPSRNPEVRQNHSRGLIRELLLATTFLAPACEADRKASNRVDIPETVIPSVKDAQRKAESEGRTLKRRAHRKTKAQGNDLSRLPKPPTESDEKTIHDKKRKSQSPYEHLPTPDSMEDGKDK